MSRGWFSDVDPDAPLGAPWQPCLDTDAGIVVGVDTWFASGGRGPTQG
jgi:hypothetical protein